jgi:hypothetical protein
MMSTSLRQLATPVLALALACGSAEDGPPDPAELGAERPAPETVRDGPPTALWETVDALRESASAHYDVSDGGGRAWLVRGPDQKPYAVSNTPDRFEIFYEVGPHGIAPGGTVYFQVSPFWEWTTPQVLGPDQRGYTEVTAESPEIELHAETLDRQLLGIEVTGRALVEGDRIRIVYGAGMAGAMPDRYAERDSAFWIAVDGDGDGTRRFLVDSPTIDVRPGPAAGLVIQVPTLVRPGERFAVTLAVIDAWRNTGLEIEADVELEAPPELGLPDSVHFAPEDGGRQRVHGVAEKAGTYRLVARASGREVQSNPMVVSAEGPRVLWGDLHGHSNYSDGTGVPEDYFVYARDVSGLDVAALTDHDHWGILPLVDHPALWQGIQEQTRAFHEPGRFVTLLGFEWTSWIHGHRHVLYFGDEGPLVDSVAPETDSPQALWSALEGQSALTFAHHSAGGPIATNWEVPPDPHFEPITEIVSIHGSSEAADSPNPIYDPVPDHFVRDVLGRGYRLGFIGSGDRHDGHPGAYQVDPPQGGLAAILSEERTREGVLDALRARRVYATNGPRMLMRFALGGHGMGSEISVAAEGKDGELAGPLFVQVIAQEPLHRIELIRSGAVVDGVLTEGRLEVTLHREIDGLRPGESLYVRAVQEDDGTGWTSPIFLTE